MHERLNARYFDNEVFQEISSQAKENFIAQNMNTNCVPPLGDIPKSLIDFGFSRENISDMAFYIFILELRKRGHSVREIFHEIPACDKAFSIRNIAALEKIHGSSASQ